MRKNRFSFRNGALIALAIFLLVGLAVFLGLNRKEEQETIQKLRQEQQKTRQGAEEVLDDESEKSEPEATPSPTAAPEETVSSTPQPTDVPVRLNLSFRGDSFVEEENQEERGYPALVDKLFAEEGKDVLVEDYTMDAAGSLSQMKLAGVEQSILDTYVAEHQKLAEEQTLRITETKIRELSEEELVREDQNSIPVICMGYYGGWCGDPEELCDQIQHILDTYTQKDKYLILGLYPSWVQDREAYHEEMTSRWGEHYFQLDDVIRNAASSDKGRQEIAEAIYQRLTEMEYV